MWGWGTQVELGSHSWVHCHVSLAAEFFRPPLSCFSDSEVFVQDFVPHSCQSSGAVWKSRWPSWAFRPNDSSLTVSVDVKQHWTMLTHWSQLVPNNCQPTSEYMKLYIIVITAQLLKQQLSSGVQRLPLCTSVVKAWRWLSDGLGFGGLPGSVGAPADEAIPRPVPDTLPYPIPTPLPPAPSLPPFRNKWL